MNLKLLLKCIEVFGLWTGVNMFLATLQTSEKLISIRINSLEHPVYFRTGNSDVSVFRSILLYKHYDLGLNFEPHAIIDGGGNIGLASVFFANKYPNSEILCIEPSTQNYHILEKNVAPYPNIQPICSGIWSNLTNLLVKSDGNGYWGHYTVEVPMGTDGAIQATSISKLMEDANFEEIDILKIDVEGAEKEIFSTNYQKWLPLTKILIIETHDKKKSGSSKAVLKAISEYDFSLKLIGENLIFYRSDIQRPK